MFLELFYLYYFIILVILLLKIRNYRNRGFEIKRFFLLEYWKSNASRFLILALITRKYLGIPASLVTSERFFSQSALIITKLRNRLNKSTFKKISYLKN